MSLVLLLVAIMVATLLFLLLTGKGLGLASTRRVIRPEVVSRRENPGIYWTEVALVAAALAVLLWLQSLKAG